VQGDKQENTLSPALVKIPQPGKFTHQVALGQLNDRIKTLLSTRWPLVSELPPRSWVIKMINRRT
jgi:hypothetical protein